MALFRRSLKTRFLMAIMLTTAIALFVACSAMVVFNLHNYKKDVISDLKGQTALIAKAITPALNFDDADSAREYLDTIKGQSSILEAAIYTQSGRLFSAYVKAGSIERLDKIPDHQGIRIEDQSVVLYDRIIFGEEIIGAVLVRMKYDILRQFLGNLVISVASIVLATIVSIVLSLYLQTNVVGPILSLSKLANRVADSKDYSVRAVKFGEDELGSLAESFNKMLDEIETTKSDLESSNNLLKTEVEERRAAEQALRASEGNISKLNSELERRVADRTGQLEVANRELESFSYSVSHDLRAPLRAIDGFSQALIEDCEGQLDEVGRDYLQRVRSAAQKMGNLIDDMLKLSRVSRAEVNFMDVDLSEMANDVVEEIKTSNPERDIKFTVTSGLHAVCDAHLMRIALVNLFHNAWKYTSKGQSSEIEFGMRLFESNPAYFVQDNGVGFDMAYAGKLFGAFQRLHTASEFPGTGIGLATVKRVISRHGGDIWARSAVGEGTTFYFTLPQNNASLLEPEGDAKHEHSPDFVSGRQP